MHIGKVEWIGKVASFDAYWKIKENLEDDIFSYAALLLKTQGLIEKGSIILMRWFSGLYYFGLQRINYIYC